MESAFGRAAATSAARRAASIEVYNVFVGVEAVCDPHPVDTGGLPFFHAHFAVIRLEDDAVPKRYTVLRVSMYLLDGYLRAFGQFGVARGRTDAARQAPHLNLDVFCGSLAGGVVVAPPIAQHVFGGEETAVRVAEAHREAFVARRVRAHGGEGIVNAEPAAGGPGG